MDSETSIWPRLVASNAFNYHLKPAVNRQPMFPRGGPEELAKSCCKSARTPELEGPRGLVKRPKIMNFITLACTRDTLISLELSPMDFPGCPAAIH